MPCLLGLIAADELTRPSRYFEHYHPYMPIVRQRDPNQCYESGQLLFWVIIYVATRRYARNSTAMPFLMEALRKEIMGAVTDMPLKLPAANALVLVCTWMFPDIRFMSDPGSLYSAIALNAATNLGAHTGKGNHPEYSVGVFQNSFSNEEAAYTWAGINIVCQRYVGAKSPSGPLIFQDANVETGYPLTWASHLRADFSISPFRMSSTDAQSSMCPRVSAS